MPYTISNTILRGMMDFCKVWTKWANKELDYKMGEQLVICIPMLFKKQRRTLVIQYETYNPPSVHLVCHTDLYCIDVYQNEVSYRDAMLRNKQVVKEDTIVPEEIYPCINKMSKIVNNLTKETIINLFTASRRENDE